MMLSPIAHPNPFLPTHELATSMTEKHLDGQAYPVTASPTILPPNSPHSCQTLPSCTHQRANPLKTLHFPPKRVVIPAVIATVVFVGVLIAMLSGTGTAVAEGTWLPGWSAEGGDVGSSVDKNEDSTVEDIVRRAGEVISTVAGDDSVSPLVSQKREYELDTEESRWSMADALEL